MGLPRQRKTKSATRQHRANQHLHMIHLAKCKNCGAAVMPHQVCPECGFYRGRQIIEHKVKAPAAKASK